MIATNDVYDEDIPYKCNPLCSKLQILKDFFNKKIYICNGLRILFVIWYIELGALIKTVRETIALTFLGLCVNIFSRSFPLKYDLKNYKKQYSSVLGNLKFDEMKLHKEGQ